MPLDLTRLKTTESSRRHAFASFRERIDSIRIEPSRNLAKRAFDDPTTCHFQASLVHWKEINISGNFTLFLDIVEPLAQSLPQIIHHRSAIVDLLCTHIEKNDPHSIEALLLLAAQLVHDLGPDFLPHYPRFLLLMAKLATAALPNDAQNSRNTSSVLEHIFNAIAYTFKYLSRTLCQNLLPTLEVLAPLLSMHDKPYVARFCAEALSFLIRKLDTTTLLSVLKWALDSHAQSVDWNDTYCLSIVVLISESLKNTKGSFHSKASLILELALDVALDPAYINANAVSIVLDIILEAVHHGSTAACDSLYNLVSQHLQSRLKAKPSEDLCVAAAQILASLLFAELGRNISSWRPIELSVSDLIAALHRIGHTSNTDEALMFLYTVLVRNCDPECLARNSALWFESLLSSSNRAAFLPFAELQLVLNKDRITQCGLARYFHQALKAASEDPATLPHVALFLARMHDHDSYGVQPHPTVLEATQKSIIAHLHAQYNPPLESVADLMQLHWRLVILRHLNSGTIPADYFETLLQSLLCGDNFLEYTHLQHDVAAATLDSLGKFAAHLSAEKIQSLLGSILGKLDQFRESCLFVSALTRFLSSIPLAVASDWLLSYFDQCASTISQNLKLPHHTSRLNAIEFLISIHTFCGKQPLEILCLIRTIEQVPLTLANGRDIALRIRHLGLDFSRSKNCVLDCSIMGNYVFGLLSNKFQPCWVAVLEVLPSIVGQFSDLFWQNCQAFIELDYANQHQAYYPPGTTDSFNESEGLLVWQARDKRIKASYAFFEREFFAKYRNIMSSIAEYCQEIRGGNSYSQHMRSQVVQALAVVSHIAERHSAHLVPLILNEREEEEDEEEEGQGEGTHLKSTIGTWLVKERNDLLGIFAKFKNLKNVYNATALYDHLLNLLCNKHLEVQKIALNVILNWNAGVISKYRDNLKNLLDDTIFRDELTNFITRTADSKIEAQDLDSLMPLVVRILFGRVQGTPKSNSKLGKKFAVVSILPNLQDHHIIMFLELGSLRIGYQDFYDRGELPLVRDAKIHFRKLMGYVNLLLDVYNTLGSKYGDVLATTIKPLIFSLVLSQQMIDNHCASDSQDRTGKSARSVRQVGMRCLSEIFKTLGEGFDWDEYLSIIYDHVIRPRMASFAIENLQQPSSLMKLLCLWIEMPNTTKLLYIDDFKPAEAVLSLLQHPNAKDLVISIVLQFAIQALSKSNVEDQMYFELLARLVNSLTRNLPSIIDNISNSENGSLAISVLLLLIDGDYIDETEAKAALLNSLTKALDKPNTHISLADKASILHSLASLVNNYDECSFQDMQTLYETCSKAFQTYADPQVRTTLVQVIASIGARFQQVARITTVLAGLNSFTNRRLHDMDFTKRLELFKVINEEMYSSLSLVEWLPLVHCGLYFINDEQELSIRTSATFLLKRFIDCFTNKSLEQMAKPFVQYFKNSILPHLRMGIRKPNGDVKAEYIDLLHHAVQARQYFDDLSDMRILTYDNHDESNFFKNVVHIQMHRRQRAVMRLAESRGLLSESSIAHYIIPIIEGYATNEEEKFRNISFETVECISLLSRCIGWSHFRAVFKRYIANLRGSKPEQLRSHVNLVVAMLRAFMHSAQVKDDQPQEDVIKNMPPPGPDLDTYIKTELLPPLLKILAVRDDNTIVARAPLSEALTFLVMCISPEKVSAELPGVLTTTCQVMRSRSEELREAVRKSLGKIASLLGPKYLRFVLTELKTALSRGSQIHVLSYTVHYILTQILQSSLKHGDLDDLAGVVVGIIMEDIFGAAGQEKDAEGYHSKMKEVKYKKSFDSGEILSSNIRLESFSAILNPLKLLLREHMPLKTQNKMDELLRRYALGLNHNESGSRPEILLTCFDIFNQASSQDQRKLSAAPLTAQQDHFMVKLNAKPSKAQISNNLFVHTLQRFALELMRTAISRNDNLMTVGNLAGFLPLLQQGLESQSEGVVISCLRILNQLVRLDFGPIENTIFEKCAHTALNIIQDTPSTNSEICQAALKFLATTIRHKPELALTDSAVGYIVVRLQPDMEEPNRQGLAFNFLKAVVLQHIMVPEIYDTMEKVSKIMVVNHAKEIRDMSRSVYLQFLLEYDQGRGKLEKQFKFLVNNLAYPTELGRQSVMELLHSIILKAGPEILGKLASSFFVALANVIIVDDSARCREMAQSLISSIFSKIGLKQLEPLAQYCHAWMSATHNSQLQRCGLNVYRIFIKEFHYGADSHLDITAEQQVADILQGAKSCADGEDVSWELVYGALSVLAALAAELRDEIFSKRFEDTWSSVVDVLLYPHSWVRLVASRLTGTLLAQLDKLSAFTISSYQLQTIAYRLMRQLGAPSIGDTLGDQIVKNLVLIAVKWEKELTLYESRADTEDETMPLKQTYHYATEYLVSKTCLVMRQQHNYATSMNSKKAAIKLLAMLIQLSSDAYQVAEQVLLTLFNFTEQPDSNDAELATLATECMQLIEEKLGVSEYTRVYAHVKQIISSRRQERKTRRAQMAINAPELAAKRKMKKHERFREKRKHEKDESGYYRDKRRRFDKAS